MAEDNALGTFLRNRRAKLDPADFGYATTRRRTPGLRREEVAQRANVSATWYTWLEQGRGGSPSAEVLEQLASSLMLSPAERDHLYVLATGRPPAPSLEILTDIAPRLQRVLDALEFCPALIKNCAWDIVAWNQAATVIFPRSAMGELGKTNLLKNMFLNPAMREHQLEWENVARFVVAAFRADAARAGFDVGPLVQELSEASEEFVALWNENDVLARTEHTKMIRHPEAGVIEFEFSAFAVDGRTDLNMVIYTPANAVDRQKVERLVNAVSGVNTASGVNAAGGVNAVSGAQAL
jgi:transcriptional regulator with XRE-family HTH domain